MGIILVPHPHGWGILHPGNKVVVSECRFQPYHKKRKGRVETHPNLYKNELTNQAFLFQGKNLLTHSQRGAPTKAPATNTTTL
jgi:hypothetical protein